MKKSTRNVNQVALAIRLIRAFRNLPQKALAADARLDISYISLLENGRQSPSLHSLAKIAGVLGVSIHLIILLSSSADQLRELSEEDTAFLKEKLFDLLIEAKELEQ